MSPLDWVAPVGFGLGLVFGAMGLVVGFCLTRGLRNWLVDGDGIKIRTFALALAVALAGSQAIEAAGFVSYGRSLYLRDVVSWPLVVFGGVVFGYGMVLANGCGSRALVLLGSGNLRSFVVLMCVGLAGYATLAGVLAPLRVLAADVSTIPVGLVPPTLAGLMQGWGWGTLAARWLPVVLIAGLLLIFAFGHRDFRRARLDVSGGIVIGLLIPLGWLTTGYLGADDFEPVPVASLTFVAPVGSTLQYLMLSTGMALSFAVATVLGVLAGSAVTALATARFRLEGFSSPGHMLRSITGSSLMGVGGALAVGCSIGQGLTGMSTLALTSLAAFASILSGAAIALRGPLRVRGM
ncbi:MAG: YeeE/YedE family protein [Rhodospirillales bacterium]|nr:MAG: YeeE/YedE family protein [Rhodospirillales bacterium]